MSKPASPAASGLALFAGNAEWLAHRYDPEHDAVHLRYVTRAEHRRATFLTDEYLGRDAAPVVVVRPALLAVRPAQAPVCFIFHSAFCLSTLLARALDVPGVVMGLKEPVILNDLIGWRHRGAAPAQVGERLGDALALLGRPFGAGEAVVIKPSNVVNGLAHAMLAMRPEARALLLAAPLDTFLRSIAKKGLDGRLWARDLMAKYLREGLIQLGLQGEDYLRLTDLQAAAIGWLAQQQLFARLASAYPERVRSLGSEEVLARPAETIVSLAKLFKLGLSARQVDEIVGGSAFTRHSKHGGAFGAAERGAEYDAAATAHGDELRTVSIWARAVADNAGVALDLPVRLLG